MQLLVSVFVGTRSRFLIAPHKRVYRLKNVWCWCWGYVYVYIYVYSMYIIVYVYIYL